MAPSCVSQAAATRSHHGTHSLKELRLWTIPWGGERCSRPAPAPPPRIPRTMGHKAQRATLESGDGPLLPQTCRPEGGLSKGTPGPVATSRLLQRDEEVPFLCPGSRVPALCVAPLGASYTGSPALPGPCYGCCFMPDTWAWWPRKGGCLAGCVSALHQQGWAEPLSFLRGPGPHFSKQQ